MKMSKFREYLSHKLHLWATRLYEGDFHTVEITVPTGERITFSCYWQWTGSWPDWQERCSCDCEDLK